MAPTIVGGGKANLAALRDLEKQCKLVASDGSSPLSFSTLKELANPIKEATKSATMLSQMSSMLSKA